MMDVEEEQWGSRMIVDADAPRHTAASFSDNYPQTINRQARIAKFRENISVGIVERSDDNLIFDVKGIEAPIANALRRILLGEVPSMAIEHVTIEENTSIMQDEILAHRLGLIPILANPRLFVTHSENEEFREDNSIKFELDITCTAKECANPEDAVTQEKYENSSVYSSHLKFKPIGQQADIFGEDVPRPVCGDILIAKLRPNHRIKLEVICTKGEGKEHAKWSPVATATYRMLPCVTIKKSLSSSKEAKELVKKCPLGVFEVDESEGEGNVNVVPHGSRRCTMCRECIRTKPFQEHVSLSRVKNHFIFSVESTGVIPSIALFREAISVMSRKCAVIKDALAAI